MLLKLRPRNLVLRVEVLENVQWGCQLDSQGIPYLRLYSLIK
jgi:hypothetical protein